MKKNRHRNASLLVLPTLTLLATFAQAQQVPNAGTILQQTQTPKPPAPSPSGTGLTIQQNNGTNLPPSAPFSVKLIQIDGNTLFDTAALHALVVSSEGTSLTLAQLGEVADRITAYYHEHGYPLARAVIPAQAIKDGVVRLMVIEARYGQIKLDNHSRTEDALLLSTLSSLQSGQPIQQSTLDHSLLLLSDIPGISDNATLQPGAEVGTSDLLIATTTPQTVNGSASADDYGNRFTGTERLGANLNVFGPLQHGDVLSINVMTTGKDMDYGRVAYDTLLNGAGTRLGASYTALHYTLGDTLSALDGHGTADVASVWLKQPWIRTSDSNLYGQLTYDHKQLDDDIDSTNIQTNRHLDNWTASLFGDWRDAHGVNSWNAALIEGRLDFDNAAAQLADASTAKINGAFALWTANVNRTQTVNQDNSLYLAFSGQWANANLDSSQKMVAGGPYTVRAYDMGVVSGDSGYLGNIELRHELGELLGGQSQAILFVDGEHVTINKTVWAPGVNGANLSGAGLGFNWFGPEQWSVKATVATPIGSTPDLVGTNKSVHAWIEIDKAM